MNGQYLCNRQITVSYAYKKDTKGERHGTPAGKLLFMEYVSLIEVLSSHPTDLTQTDRVLIWYSLFMVKT